MKGKMKKPFKIAVVVALVVIAAGALVFNSGAYFRERLIFAASSNDAAVVTLDKTGTAQAGTGSIDTHFGNWETGDPFAAEFEFVYDGNITAYVAPQLDMIGSDGENHNGDFSGTYTIAAGSVTETYSWQGEQISTVIAQAGTTTVEVTYDLTVSNDLGEGVTISPEFTCAALQALYNDGLEASCKKIADGTQTGFSDSIEKEDVAGPEAYAKETYTEKTLKFTVTPDNRTAATAITVYKLFSPESYKTAGFAEGVNVLSDSNVTAAKDFALPFAAREGMNCTVIVDASNEEAGHSVYAYRITWPEGGSLSVTKEELDKTGKPLAPM